jgi:hypothetical protein
VDVASRVLNVLWIGEVRGRCHGNHCKAKLSTLGSRCLHMVRLVRDYPPV